MAGCFLGIGQFVKSQQRRAAAKPRERDLRVEETFG
jgi:hypothetical protein